MLCRDEAGLPSDKQSGPWAGHEGRWESGGILQSFLTSTPKWRRVVSFMLRSLYSRGWSPYVPTECEVGWTSQPFRKNKNSFPCWESKRHSSVLPPRRAVALPTVLPRLRSQANVMSFYNPRKRSSLLLYASVTVQWHCVRVLCRTAGSAIQGSRKPALKISFFIRVVRRFSISDRTAHVWCVIPPRHGAALHIVGRTGPGLWVRFSMI